MTKDVTNRSPNYMSGAEEWRRSTQILHTNQEKDQILN
uniref:Uncharacterized protein n=1 Tax=Arundo donax TaxID=35708 RepID=A0A0A9B984_ARUDO